MDGNLTEGEMHEREIQVLIGAEPEKGSEMEGLFDRWDKQTVSQADEVRSALAGRDFGNSADLIRADRDR